MTNNWRAFLSSYDDGELAALTFSTEAEIDRAIEHLWSERNLRHAPRDYADGVTMIVPNELASILKNHGFRFRESGLVNSETMSGEEIARMRRKYGM